MMISKVMFHIHSLGQGGAERVVINLAKEMISRGISLSIATAETEETEFALPEGAVRFDIGTRPEEENESSAKKRNMRKKRLHDLLLKEKPDVVHILTPHYLHAPMAIFATAAATFALSAVAALLIRKIPLLGKWIC